MNYVWMAVFGFFVGLIARFVMPGKDSMGMIATIILGIIGSFVGGWIAQVTGFSESTQMAGWLMSVIGALVVLFIYNRFLARKV